MKIKINIGDMIKLDLSSYAPKVVDMITPAITNDGWLVVTDVMKDNYCRYENQNGTEYLEAFSENITDYKKL